jgi:hypothetical protein
VDEWAEQAGTAEPVEVYARLTQTAPLAEHVADAEGAADEGVDVDATGQDVAPGGGEVDGVAGGGELVEHLGGDQGEVVGRVGVRRGG